MDNHKSKKYEPIESGNLSQTFPSVFDEKNQCWTVTGSCPECSVEVTRVYKITAITAAAAGGIAVDGEEFKGELRTMTCDCGRAHEDRPVDEIGCGAFWKVAL